ncbi:Hypothetical protein FSTVST1_252 [Faustovirus ST1]|nr:Hypothetical protein FSTVST1_252 [Faustovirus ST1]
MEFKNNYCDDEALQAVLEYSRLTDGWDLLTRFASEPKMREEEISKYNACLNKMHDVHQAWKVKFQSSEGSRFIDLNTSRYIPTQMLSHYPIGSVLRVCSDDYTLLLVDDIPFSVVDCGSVAIDSHGAVVDFSTCLYNCLFMFLRSKGMIIGNISIADFIASVHEFMNTERIIGEFAGEEVISAVCNMYDVNVICLWKSNHQAVTIYSPDDFMDGGKNIRCMDVCYIVNESGNLHFQLMAPIDI